MERLRLEVPAFKKVGGAADLPGAEDALKQVPAAFVMLLAESAAANELLSGALSQRVVVRFAVLIAASNLNDATGEAALATLVPLREAVNAMLLNWQPHPSFDPCEFARGQLLQVADRVLWWQDEYVTAFYLRKVPNE